MHSPARVASFIFGLCAFTFATLLVTAAVTRAYGSTEQGGAPATWYVVITDLDNPQNRGTYTRQTWLSREACERDLGNLPEWFAAVADPKTTSLPELTGPNAELNEANVRFAMSFVQSQGHAPRFSIACEMKGDPA